MHQYPIRVAYLPNGTFVTEVPSNNRNAFLVGVGVGALLMLAATSNQGRRR